MTVLAVLFLFFPKYVGFFLANRQAESDTSATKPFVSKTTIAVGTASITLVNGGQETSQPHTFTITVNQAGTGSLNLKEDVYVIGSSTISVSAASGVLANDTATETLSVTTGRA